MQLSGTKLSFSTQKHCTHHAAARIYTPTLLTRNGKSDRRRNEIRYALNESPRFPCSSVSNPTQQQQQQPRGDVPREHVPLRLHQFCQLSIRTQGARERRLKCAVPCVIPFAGGRGAKVPRATFAELDATAVCEFPFRVECAI